MTNKKLEKAAFHWWHHHQYKLKDIDDFLKLASGQSGKNYDRLYNGYMLHADYV
ncbi:Avirulence protein [Phytophthora megakarya]|uniref:Avirulence protein n=1 Tax=Phytophthora megakarya TaxID=4795 RepID=A0A225W8E6_9STRA|nr:Avirulence protein [Phytophthora megakarya]